MMPFNDLQTQYRGLKESIDSRIARVLEHGQYIMGPEVFELEEKLADYVGVRHCISASSGTDTLLIAMMAIGVGRGDEVITAPFSFIATCETIMMLGATPVFVDISPRSYNIDPSKIEEAITPRTRAIMPVSLFGQCADMDAINLIAQKHNIPVIEDAAQSFGATYKGKKSCGLSTIGSTSFFPSKPLGCYGDGGALFTNDDELALVMRQLRLHGSEKRYYHTRIGINGRLDTIQAAVLLAKLERFDWEVEARHKLGALYGQLLTTNCAVADCCNGATTSEPSCSGMITPPWVAPNSTSVYAQYTIAVQDRDSMLDKLRSLGIPTSVHYPLSLHLQPALASLAYGDGSFPVAEKMSHRVLSLPMSADLRVSDVEQIVAGVLS